MAFTRKTLSTIITTVVLVSLAAPSFAAAATALKLMVPWDHEYLYWTHWDNIRASFIDGHVKALPLGKTYIPPLPSPWPAWASGEASPARFKGKTTTIELPGFPAGVSDLTVAVYDISTGNEAIERVGSESLSKGLTLQKRDFDKVRRVRIKVTADHGKPVESAFVKLKDIAGRQQKAMIDPTTIGVAEFTDVTTGDATVDVLYGDGKKASQEITIPEEHEPIYATEVPVVGPVATVEEVRAGESATKHGKTRLSGAEWAAALLGSIFGFLLLVAIVVGGLVFLRRKGVTMEESLKKMGVELPEGAPETAAPAPPAPAVDPNVCQFCGQRKDAQGNCACTIAPAPASAPSGASTGPRLIGTQGSYAANIFELTSDITTMGREADNSIPLPNDTTVSRHHARIAREAGGYVVYDAGSSNGVFVNGDKVDQHALQPGDEVQVGSTKFRFEM